MRCRERILGLDLVVSQLRALRENRFLGWLADCHAGMPSTFPLTCLGTRQIATRDAANLRTLSALLR